MLLIIIIITIIIDFLYTNVQSRIPFVDVYKVLNVFKVKGNGGSGAVWDVSK